MLQKNKETAGEEISLISHANSSGRNQRRDHPGRNVRSADAQRMEEKSK
jgi:hypothetical protein